MSLESKLIALATAIGADVKALTLAQGSLSALTTTTKTSLVAAINELVGLVGSGGGAVIDDAATNGDTTVTWSADKIFDSIAAAKAALKSEILGGAGAAFDTLSELAAALGNDASFATTIATEIGNRVRYDAAQSLTTGEATQARSNIGAASAATLSTLLTDLGDLTTDLSAVYVTAKT